MTGHTQGGVGGGYSFWIASYCAGATSSTPVAATVLARLFSAFASVTSAAASLSHKVNVNPVASLRSMRNTAPALPGRPATNGLTCLFTCSAHRSSASGEPFHVDVLATIVFSTVRRGSVPHTPRTVRPRRVGDHPRSLGGLSLGLLAKDQRSSGLPRGPPGPAP